MDVLPLLSLIMLRLHSMRMNKLLKKLYTFFSVTAAYLGTAMCALEVFQEHDNNTPMLFGT